MVINKNIKGIHLLIGLYVLLGFNLDLMSDDKLSSTILNSNINPDKLPNKETDLKDPLKGVNLYLNKIVNLDNKEILSQINSNQLSLQSNEYIQIRDIDKRLLLFNGNIIIRFKNMPDLESFASANQIILVTSLSDIGMGVFKVSNIYDLELKIDQIKNNENITSIELDTVDLSIIPN